MMTLSQLTTLLGWAAVINIIYLALAVVVLWIARKPVVALHHYLFRVSEETLNGVYLSFLSYYKIVTLVFFVAPYIALKIMGY